ncbi:hypothetical protein Cgig2_028268 [Carnegiea gigantea]|uniref:Uncharacterized protein n=1 Tax=Carnegiea gigantea TaxID=171969 RepID=A0A9Q1GXF0_9CARY|nr:hypothetical protein Cgig2_028268 [Carnegiea gigantea]
MLFAERSLLSGEKFTCGFQEWLARAFHTLACATPFKGSVKKKRDNSSNEDVPRYEGASSLRPKLKNVHSRKPLGPSTPAIEDNTPYIKIVGVGDTILVTPISAIPIQSVAMPLKVPDDVRLTPKPSLGKALIFVDNDPKLNESKSISTPNDDDEAESNPRIEKSCCVLVGSKPDEAFNRLDIEGICYKAIMAKLEQVELRRKELLKE